MIKPLKIKTSRSSAWYHYTSRNAGGEDALGHGSGQDPHRIMLHV